MEKLESVKVLGSGCKNCKTLYQNTIDALAESGVATNVEYITDMQKIAETGVMSMPALLLNDKVVSAGKVLSVKDVQKLLDGKFTGTDTQAAGASCSCGGNC